MQQEVQRKAGYKWLNGGGGLCRVLKDAGEGVKKKYVGTFCRKQKHFKKRNRESEKMRTPKILESFFLL